MRILVLYSPAIALIIWAGLIHAFGNTDEVSIGGCLLTALACIAHAIVATHEHRR